MPQSLYSGHVPAYAYPRRQPQPPAAFSVPCRPIFSQRPPRGSGWAHELKQDGYRLQIHIRNGRVRLYTMNGADWSKRYPLIVRDAARIKGSAIQVWLDSNGVADFEALHSRSNDARATALAFDLLMLDEEDMRRKSYVKRKAALRKLLRGDGGIQYVEHTEGHGDRLFNAVCTIGLEGIVSKKLDSPYRSGPSKAWIKVKNPKAPAATRAQDGTF
ncbi:MAG: DNA ligase [Pseudolabrys sp.]